MARITWLGEGGDSSPTVIWYGHELRAGEAVELDDARLLAKARGSRFFKVEEQPTTQWREPATEADPADELPLPPEPAPPEPHAVTRPKFRPARRR